MTTAVDSQYQLIRDKILKVLEIYPKVSPSMLQIGIGSSIPAQMWRPVLERLIEEGTIIQDDIVSFSASERQQVYRVIHIVGA